MKRFLFVISFFIFGIGGVFAQITLPSFFSEGMILQQNAECAIWGWAEAGEKVSVKGSWSRISASTTADENGKWMVKLKTPKAGGPYTLVIEGKEKIEINEVLTGEVWLASGQSNMEMPMKGFPPNDPILRSDEIIADANYPQIRFFKVEKDRAFIPLEDVTGEWRPANPFTVPDFSAVGYTYALELHKKLNVPIGIIESNWGGTVAEAWTSEAGLRKLGDFDGQLGELRKMTPENYEKTIQENEEKMRQWEERELQILTEMIEPDYDDSDWKLLKTPSLWEYEGYPDLDGIAWYRTTIQIPDSWAEKDLILNLGPVNDDDITWFNGFRIGASEGSRVNRKYEITGRMVQAGENHLAIRVVDVGGTGGIYGNEKDLKLYPSEKFEGDTLYLAGQWKFKPVAHKPKLIRPDNANNPTVLFNAMISPLAPYQIKGVIWYQGESNVGRDKQYNDLFPLMINDWRNLWNIGDFSFYFVQIAPFPYGGDGTHGAALRDAQRRSLRVENTGMVVTMDIGDTTNIHPANKADIGDRLARWALTKDYGRTGIEYSGPLYQSVKIKKNRIVVQFSHAGTGLSVRGSVLRGFEIAGKDGRYVPAEAVVKGGKVEVWAEGLKKPVTVRYGWRDNAQPSLFNKAGLPASTFTTEDYK